MPRLPSLRFGGLILGLCVLLGAPADAVAQGGGRVGVNTAAETLTVGAWIQPVWERTFDVDGPDLQGFFLRRARLDVRGSLNGGRVHFRILPDFARNPELRDTWVEVRSDGGWSMRMGQQTVPFDLQRSLSMGGAHRGERAIAARRFELAGGRDLGAVAGWTSRSGTLRLEGGAFGGEGINRSAPGEHPLWSVRGTASFGGLPARVESDRALTPTPVLTLGIGGMAARGSTLRPRPGFSSDRSVDWWGGTSDVHLRWQGWTAWGALYRQEIRIESPGGSEGGSRVRPPLERGGGWILSAGTLLAEGRVQVAVQGSEAQWDRSRGLSPEREFGIGVTLFHVGHEVQSRIQLARQSGPVGSPTQRGVLLTIEHQLLLGGL
jgi:hypothetical protein